MTVIVDRGRVFAVDAATGRRVPLRVPEGTSPQEAARCAAVLYESADLCDVIGGAR